MFVFAKKNGSIFKAMCDAFGIVLRFSEDIYKCFTPSE
jgi:hypothetical protein